MNMMKMRVNITDKCVDRIKHYRTSNLYNKASLYVQKISRKQFWCLNWRYDRVKVWDDLDLFTFMNRQNNLQRSVYTKMMVF